MCKFEQLYACHELFLNSHIIKIEGFRIRNVYITNSKLKGTAPSKLVQSHYLNKYASKESSKTFRNSHLNIGGGV